MLKHISLVFLTALTACLFTATTAFAEPNDVVLTRICNSNSACSKAEAQDAFDTLSRSYAIALAPMHMMPASTLGEAGFAIDLESKISFPSDKDEADWKATNRGKAPDMLATIQLHMRKGLPFSLEVEADFSYLFESSSMFYVGGGLRWAITEGWSFLPDLSVRGHVGTLVGGSMIQNIDINVDATLSYTWGLGGICAITPYGGYSLLIARTSSRTFVTTDNRKDGNRTEEEFHFGANWSYLSRGFVGFELKADYFIFDVAGEFGADMMSVGAKIGTQF